MRRSETKTIYFTFLLLFFGQTLVLNHLYATEGKAKVKKKKKISTTEAVTSAGGEEQSPAPSEQNFEDAEIVPEPALKFGVQGAVSLDMIKIKDTDSSLAGLTLDLMGRMNYRLGPSFILPIGLGMGFTSWAGEAKFNGATITYTVSATAIALDIAGLYGISPKAYIGLFVDNRYGLSGQVKVESKYGGEKAEKKTKLDKFSYLLYGPAFYYNSDNNRIFQFDLGVGSGSYEDKDGLAKTEYTDTRLRFAFNYML